MDKLLIVHLMDVNEFLLELMGYETFKFDDIVGIANSSGVKIGPPCNGLNLMALYIGFLILIPGNIKQKLRFIALGILVIHVLNIIRVLALILLAYYAPQYLEFNHSYTFNLIIYLVIFFMWLKWIKQKGGSSSVAADKT